MAAYEELIIRSPEQIDLLELYSAGYNVLTAESERIQAAVDVLSTLSSQAGDVDLMPAVAAVATSEETPALEAVELLPLINAALEPFQPKQQNPDSANNVRWTMDWKAIKGSINERVKAAPETEALLKEWFISTGASLVETTYAPNIASQPLYVETGGANDQCAFRAVLVLASMASTEFRQTNKLTIANEHGLQGEDDQNPGWLKDQALISALRQHVAGRIAAGEISPRILVLGSAAQGRVLKNAELDTITNKYLSQDTSPLYTDRGITEADAMLAGSIIVFGGDPATINVVDVASTKPAEIDREPAKLVQFESEVGPVTLMATVGSEANILEQVLKAQQITPELFNGIDGLYGTTTAIYTWAQRAILQDVANKLKLDVPVDMLGLSAHAAGVTRGIETLVGELTNYLKAVHDLAVKTLASAEKYTQSDLVLSSGRLVVNEAINSAQL